MRAWGGGAKWGGQKGEDRLHSLETGGGDPTHLVAHLLDEHFGCVFTQTWLILSPVCLSKRIATGLQSGWLRGGSEAVCPVLRSTVACGEHLTER